MLQRILIDRAVLTCKEEGRERETEPVQVQHLTAAGQSEGADPSDRAVSLQQQTGNSATRNW